MTCKRFVILAALLVLAVSCPAAHGHGGGIGVGVYIGGPAYYYPRPYWGPYYYYRPVVPVYVAPPPVIVQPAPAPVVVQPATPVVEAQPTPSLQTVPVQPATRVETRADEIDQWMQQLSNPDDKARADAAIRLGRLKARRAAEPLERMVLSDPSADVRDAAARGLGLIGMPASVRALQQAAQVDNDRGVRASAQFAIEVIRNR
jgi:hypothetical protein